jgi:Mn2+/Fe2+ NRAMP family transporter
MVATVVAYAVVVTAGATLHVSGMTEIETTAEAAAMLRPLAGPLTHTLFSLGILAAGLLAIPMLAGSAAYAVGESRGWPIGLARTPKEARAFYGFIVASTLVGAALNLLGVNSIQALLWSAVINGVLSVPVLAAMMLIAARSEIMGQLVLTRLLRILGWVTVSVMAIVTLAFLATLF